MVRAADVRFRASSHVRGLVSRITSGLSSVVSRSGLGVWRGLRLETGLDLVRGGVTGLE